MNAIQAEQGITMDIATTTLAEPADILPLQGGKVLPEAVPCVIVPVSASGVSYLPTPASDAVVRSLAELPTYPGAPPDTTRKETWELWCMHFLARGEYSRARDELKAARDSQTAEIACFVTSLLSGLMTTLSLGWFASGNGGWLVGSMSSVLFAGLCVTMAFRSIKHSRRRLFLENACKRMRGALWYKNILDTLLRLDAPRVPPVLVRIARTLCQQNPMANDARRRLNLSLSTADHVDMIRLTKKLEGTNRVMFGEETVVELDGDTQELCSRVLDVMGGKEYTETKEGGPTVLRF